MVRRNRSHADLAESSVLALDLNLERSIFLFLQAALYSSILHLMNTNLPGLITNRLDRIRRGDDPQLIARMASGWAILGNQQPDGINGCCMLLPDPVVPSINDLNERDRSAFMTDFICLGDAVLAATGAERINYLILCNQVPELHGHAIPRFNTEDSDARRLGPFEAYDFAGARRADAEGRDVELIRQLRAELADATHP
jgi:diadenosine tetraphosphate (Ap4A) HIT family hydrolase